MKGRRFTLTLTLAMLFVVALVAIPLIAQEQQECNPDEKWKKTCSHVQVFGNGKVEKPDNVVKAKAQCPTAPTVVAKVFIYFYNSP